uniref:Uncharacterized protein n=1 Tax=Sinocyclocheilus anshuiensis TaxID=1608454 RepID=A0A671KH57_9TELE
TLRNYIQSIGICLQCLFDYETPVMLVIITKRVGALFRLIQLLIITYVAGRGRQVWS